MMRERIAILTLAAVLAAPPTLRAQACGDCDGSMQLTIVDALVAAQIAVTLVTPTAAQERVCDVQGDLDVDVIDGLVIAQVAAGLPVTLTCPAAHPVVNSCAVLTTVTGQALVPYELSDGDSSLVDVLVEVSTDGGMTFQATTQGAGGDPVTGIMATPTPTSYTYSWDSAGDLQGGTGVLLRFTPSDSGGVGSDCVTAPFDVDNNDAPVATACATRSGATEARFVYTSPDSTDLPGWSIDPLTGSLTPIPGSPFTRTSGGGGFTTNARGMVQCNGYLYVNNSGSTRSVSGFSVDPITGVLTELPGSPWPTPAVSTAAIVADEARGLLAVTGQELQIMVQDPMTGALTLGSTVTSVSSCLGADWHPTSGRVYVSSGWGAFSGFDVSAAGVATIIPGAPWTPSGYAHTVRVNAAGTLVFSDNLTAGIDVWDIDPMTGALTLRASSPFNSPVLSSALGLALDEPNDRIFLGCRCGNQFSVFTGVSTGNLVYQASYGSGGTEPVGLEYVDDRLFVVNEGTPVAVFDYPAMGAPTQVPGSPFTPMGATSGTSSFLVYRVPAAGSGILVHYDLDDTEGDLVDVLVEFSTDGVSYSAATRGMGGDPVTGLATTPGMPTSYVFDWDHTVDLPMGAPMAWIRVTPSDPFETGTDCGVGSFSVP